MKTELLHLTNRQELPEGAFAAGEVIENVQICPIGDFPNGDKMQHCTAEALRNVAEQWRADGAKEILVDFEHNSEQGGTSDTSAAAWVSNVRVDPERGLVGDFKLTDVGAEAISNRRLRFLSVAWFVNKETREPISITSIALTNKPNIPVAPILNKEPEPVEEIENVIDAHGQSHGEDGKFDGGNGSASVDDVLKDFDGGEEFNQMIKDGIKDGIYSKNPKKLKQQLKDLLDDELQDEHHARMLDATFNKAREAFYLNKTNLKNKTVEDKKENPNMDKIKEALGLAPEATEEDVLNAITAMVSYLILQT